MKTTIITAIYDDYDTLKPTLEQSIDVDWVLVTDNVQYHQWPNETYAWKVVYEPRPHVHPNRAAKTPKMLPWLYTDTETSIWIDASYQVTSPTFAEEVLNYAQPIAQFRHPWRDCIYDEISESGLLPKYEGEREKLDELFYLIRSINHPSKWGLWATGVIARRHIKEVKDMGFDWMKMVHTYTYQDQCSHPMVCRLNGLKPIDLPGTHLANEWLSYQGSGRH